ncbi:MAG: nicotinate-nucleotide--dimethylbenzimidazole phosphoribosyltransferase, partial [Anaerovorax sp.]
MDFMDWEKMTEQELKKLLGEIKPLDQVAMAEAERRQLLLAKPPGSLGRLEDISIQIAGITGRVINDMDKTCIAIMSADNGVVSEGISSAPQGVTLAQTINFTRRITGVGSLAKHFGIDLLVVDMGINGEVPPALLTKEMKGVDAGDGAGLRFVNQVVDRKLGPGTKNLSKEPAMSPRQVLQGIATGIEAASQISAMGYHAFGVGEMGIGNTTTSAAVLSALTGLPGKSTVGKGGGITQEAFLKKIAMVDQAILRNGLGSDGCGKVDVLEVLGKVGGFDIVAMVGAFIGAAIYRIPVVIDGYISVVAALAAVRLAPEAGAFMVASHASWEQGYRIAIHEL